MIRVLFLSLVAAASIGCGTVSYKRGGTESDQQVARDRCHNAGRTESPDFERCMEEQRWIVKRLGESAAPRDEKKSIPSESASAGRMSSPAAGSIAPSFPLSNARSAEHPIVVTGWFKLGGTPGELDAATQRCVAKLGVAHRPELAPYAVTGEMLDCLRAEGWRPLESH